MALSLHNTGAPAAAPALISLTSFGNAEVRRHGQLYFAQLSAAAGADGFEVREELLIDAVRHPDKSYRIDRHMQVHGVTYQTARTDLGSLVELKLMRCQRIGRAFLYTPVPDLVQRLK